MRLRMKNFEPDNGGKETKKEGYPFVALRETDIAGNKSKFFRVPGMPNIIVRNSFIRAVGETSQALSTKAQAEYLKGKIDEFKKIIEKYPVRAAKTDYVIGADSVLGNPSIYCVTEVINGESLENLHFLSKETADKIDNLYEKIIADFVVSYFKNGYFWFDPTNEQFMFGKARGDKKPDIYLVDVDPNVFKWNDGELERRFGLKRETWFLVRILQIARELNDLEKKVTENTTVFFKTRKKIERLKRKMPEIIKNRRKHHADS
jgi:hypothetical protein